MPSLPIPLGPGPSSAFRIRPCSRAPFLQLSVPYIAAVARALSLLREHRAASARFGEFLAAREFGALSDGLDLPCAPHAHTHTHARTHTHTRTHTHAHTRTRTRAHVCACVCVRVCV